VDISHIPSSIQVTTSVIQLTLNLSLLKYISYTFYHIFYTALFTATVVTYLQYVNIHITFVNGNNARIDVMARPNSSQCMYTSTNMPITVLKQHTVTVTIYIV